MREHNANSIGAPAEIEQGLRVAVVGVSVSPVCGAHDHAMLLAEALQQEGISFTEHWLWRGGGSIGSSRAEIGRWAERLLSEIRASRPDAVLLHYSVFSYSHRGLPLFVGPVLSALHRSRIPVVMVLHEFAYAWFLGGWWGKVWAITQRAALIKVMRVASGVLVTTDIRADYLTSRRWLPQRPVAFAPVYSNLPAPRIRPSPDRGVPLIGLFGYSYEGAESAIVLDAFSELRATGVDAQLTLLGAGGRSSAAGHAWLAAARDRGIEDALSFSGTLPAQELSDALAACDLLLSAFSSGPSSRKGTLAASVASGRPVIALEGPRGWSELIQSEAIALAAPTAPALAEAIRSLLADAEQREALGARGRSFAERSMGVARTAQAMRGLLGQALANRAA